ncbi:MAG TPA: anthrone oxygenase family protein [Ilumatobacter sp.]
MVEGGAAVLVFISAIGSGLVAGVFFAFSTFVMRSLAKLPAPMGIAAMQSINVYAPNPLFMLALFGTAGTAVAAAVIAVADWGDSYAVYTVIGAVVYLVMVVLTAVYHIPRNNALDKLDPDDPRAVAQWERYLREWTGANHVRTIAPLIAAILFTVALRVT